MLIDHPDLDVGGTALENVVVIHHRPVVVADSASRNADTTLLGSPALVTAMTRAVADMSATRTKLTSARLHAPTDSPTKENPSPDATMPSAVWMSFAS